MKIAYLVNQYPKASHTFIRREIAAIERAGVSIDRFTVRRTREALPDLEDQAERDLTRPILSAWRMCIATIARTVCCPVCFVRALAMAIRLGWRSDVGVRRHLIYLGEACVLIRWLSQSNVEHLHAHFGTNSAAVALLTRILGGPPFSFTVHGPEEFDRMYGLSLPEKIAHAEFLVAISEFGRAQLMRRCGVEHWHKIQVVRCGLDARFLEQTYRTTSPPDTHELICVGRLCEQKGQLLLLEAIHALVGEFPKLHLTLVGDGPMRSAIESYSRKLGITHHVRITGWQSGKQVCDHIVAARAVVLPSFAEGLPVVLMEALAMGRPVISTYVAGIPELIEDGLNGWLIPAGSAERLTRALQCCLTTRPGQLAEMGRHGRDRVMSQHNAAIEAAKLINLFEASLRKAKLLNNRVAHPPTTQAAIAPE